MTHINNVNFNNFYFYFYDASKPLIGSDASGFGGSYVKQVGVYTEEYFNDRFLHRKPKTPCKGTVGFVSCHGSNDEMARIGYDTVCAGGLYIGFMLNADHLIINTCTTARCCYGYYINGTAKTLTMLNCCDEGNTHLPHFGPAPVKFHNPGGGNRTDEVAAHQVSEERRPNSFTFQDMKTIEVVAAIIIRDGKVFATQRGYGQWQGWWEFPGGKIESGERPEEALVREIQEELDAEIEVGDLLETVEWDYPDFHLTMHCFLCSLLSDSFHLNEHEAAAWLTPEALHSVRWLPADEGLVDKLRHQYMKLPSGIKFEVLRFGSKKTGNF